VSFIEAGREFPPWDKRPRLAEDLVLHAVAYRDLATCRPEYGRQLPWTALNAYADAKGIVERERFEHLIRAMDDEHLSAVQRRDEARKRG
jgi:hypothetical protein